MHRPLSSPNRATAAPSLRWPWLAASLALHLLLAGFVLGLADRSRPAEPATVPALEVDLTAAPPQADAAAALPTAPVPDADAPPDPIPQVEPPPAAEPPPVAAEPAPVVPPRPVATARPPPAPARPVPRQPRANPSNSAVAAPPQAPPAAEAARPAAASAPPADWDQLISAWIAAHRSYPELARRRGDTGAVTLRISVAADGRVTEVTVVDATGARELTDAAVALLSGATVPAPQVPAVRTVRIRYRLEN